VFSVCLSLRDHLVDADIMQRLASEDRGTCIFVPRDAGGMPFVERL
jgi:hypothetical protein